MVKKKIIESVKATDSKTKRWKSLFNAGRIAYESGEYRQAESLVARARELARELPEKSFAANATEIGWGAIILGKGQAPEAASRLQKSINGLRGNTDDGHKELLAVALRFHAQALIETADQRTAEKELLESLSILEDLGVDAAVQLGYTLCDLCGLYLSQGRMSEAEQYIKSAMEIMFAVFGPESPEYVRADMISTVCQQTEEDQFTAVPQGIERLKCTFGQNHPHVTRVLNRYLKVMADRGDTARLEEVKERLGLVSKKQQKSPV